MQIVKQSDANAVAVSEQLLKTIAILEKDYKVNQLKLEVAKDSTVFTLEAADSVVHDLLIAVFCSLPPHSLSFLLSSFSDHAPLRGYWLRP